MACSLYRNIHPDALCRQYEKQASENLFLKPGNASNIWVVEPTIETPHTPAISEFPLQSETNTRMQKAASSNDLLIGVKARHGAQSPFSQILVQEGSDVGEALSKHPRILHIMNSTNSWSRLDVTQQVFESLCHELEIFEVFKESIAFMGRRFREVEVAPPRCEWEITERHVDSKIEVCVESIYTLRYIDINAGYDDSRPWSLRQMTLYNRHRSSDEPSWVFISLPDQVMGAVGQYTRFLDSAQPLRCAIQLHLSFLAFGVRCWRPYLVYLTKEIETCNGNVTCAAPPTSLRIDFALLRVRMKNLESQLDDALLAVRTNSQTAGEVITVFLEYLSPLTAVEAEASALRSSLNALHTKFARDYAVLTLEFESLRCKLQSCIQVASSFAEIMNGQLLNQNSQSLRTLAEEQREEAHHMGVLADKGRRDALAVKGLSIITLIYLPSTVVLNFFSASFIDTSSGEMVLVGQWWMFLVVGVPLTVVTLAAWAFWMKYRLQQSEHKHQDLEKASQGL